MDGREPGHKRCSALAGRDVLDSARVLGTSKVGDGARRMSGYVNGGVRELLSFPHPSFPVLLCPLSARATGHGQCSPITGAHHPLARSGRLLPPGSRSSVSDSLLDGSRSARFPIVVSSSTANSHLGGRSAHAALACASRSRARARAPLPTQIANTLWPWGSQERRISRY